MELIRYAPHLRMEETKVNKFVFGLNFNIRVKVRILMPQTFNDVVHKALIAQKEMNNGGQGGTPTRPIGQNMVGAQQHQTLARHTIGYQYTKRLSMFMTP
jgi:hypothetical protein